MIVLDTNIVIYLLEGRLVDTPDLRNAAVSVITEIELLSHKKLDSSSEASIRSLLRLVETVGLTDSVKDTAIRLRRNLGLTVPDAIIVATARTRGAVLLTNDEKLLHLPDVASRAITLANKS